MYATVFVRTSLMYILFKCYFKEVYLRRNSSFAFVYISVLPSTISELTHLFVVENVARFLCTFVAV